MASKRRPTEFKSVQDIVEWIIEHDTRIDAFWEAQHKLNEKVETKFDKIVGRLTALEKRVIWMAGFAAALGSILATIIKKYI